MIAMTTDTDDKSLRSFAKEETLIATNDCLRRADAASEQEQSTSTWLGGELLGAIGNYSGTIANSIGNYWELFQTICSTQRRRCTTVDIQNMFK